MTTSPTSNSYSPELLAALERAFKFVWETLYAHVPVDGDAAKELQIKLSRTLVALASDGLTNSADLRRRALEMLALNPR